jgi:HPt (histidine-containing phosphotransfer) domain-containing protein
VEICAVEFSVLLGGEEAALAGLSQAFASCGAACEFVADSDALVTAALIRDFDLIVIDPRLPRGGPVPAYEMLRQLGIAAPLAMVAVPGCDGVLPPTVDALLDLFIDPARLASLLDKARSMRVQDGALEAVFADECDALAGEFRAALPAKLAELETAVADRNYVQLQSLLHRLKGVAGSFGFPDITSRCAAIESQLRAGSTEDPAKETLAMTASVRQGIASAGQIGSGAPVG